MKTQSSLGNVRIEVCQILQVDPDDFSIVCRSEMSEQPNYRLSMVSPALNQNKASGFRYLPSTGETALVLTASDGTRHILGFIAKDGMDGTFLGGFKQNPGDMVFAGENGNFLRLYSGGIIELGATPICSTIYIPIRNLVHTIGENIILDSLAGSLEFSVGRKEDSSDAHSPTNMQIKVKEFANDGNEIVRLKLGGGQDSNAFTLTIKDSGNGEVIKSTIKLTKDGDLNVSLEKDYTINIKGKHTTTSTGDMSFETKGNLSEKAAGDVTISGNSMKLSSNTVATISSTSTNIDSTSVTISNSAAFFPLRTSPSLMANLNALTAITKIPLVDLYFNPDVLI